MKKKLLTIAVLSRVLASAHAGLILSDDFTYPDGNLVGNGTWLSHSAGGSQPIKVQNDQIHVVNAAGSAEDDSAPLAGAPYATNSGVKLYSRYSLILSNASDIPTTVAGGYISHFKDAFVDATHTGNSFHARVFVSTVNIAGGGTASPGNFFLGIGNGSLASATNGQWPVQLTTGVVYTVVTRCDLGNNQTSTLWINPNAESDPSVTANDFNDPSNQLAMAAYAFRQNSIGGGSWIDSLRVGTIFADVAGSNTSPAISAISDQSIPANSNTGPLAFTVEDAETASGLTVTASSGNTTLVPNNPANLTLTGSPGTNRTITVTPALNQQGTATITVSVSDSVNTSFTTFKVKVGFPSISAIPSQIITSNTPTPAIPFTIGDSESPASSLHLRATSDNSTLVTTGDIALGGSGSNRTVTVTPEPNLTGLANISIFVDDGAQTNSTTFALTVKPNLGILFSDNFSYPDGYLVPNGGWQHSSPSGTNFDELVMTNGMVQLSRLLDEDAGNGFTGQPYFPSNGVVFYVGFQSTFVNLPSNVGDYFLHLKDATNGSNFRAKAWVSTTNAAAGGFRFGVLNSAGSGPFMFDRSLSLNHQYNIVMRYNQGSGETRLWVNPTSEASQFVDALDNTITSTIGGIGLRQPGGGIGTNFVDNLVVSTAFADVMQNPLPVPEPLQASIMGGNLTLTWTNALMSLQSASTVTGPYSDVINASSPYQVPAAAVGQYYRLKY